MDCCRIDGCNDCCVSIVRYCYIPRVVVIIAGVSTFVWCKKDIDRQRLELLRADQRAGRIKPPRSQLSTIGNAGRHS
jgi:hypothetical protein